MTGRQRSLAIPPWPLIERARALLQRYLAEPPAVIDAVVFWCLHTWAHGAFDVSPRLILHARDPCASGPAPAPARL